MAKGDKKKQAASSQRAAASSNTDSSQGSVSQLGFGFGGFYGSQPVYQVASGTVRDATNEAIPDDAIVLAGYVPPVTAQQLQKLTKKDSLTRIKGLQAIAHELTTSTDAAEWISAFSAAWAQHYRKLVYDNNKSVRIECARVMAIVAGIGGRTLAPNLKQLLPTWHLAAFEAGSDAGTIAMKALKDLFPGQKYQQVLFHAHQPLIQNLYTILTAKPEAMGDAKRESMDDLLQRHQRLASQALLALSDMLRQTRTHAHENAKREAADHEAQQTLHLLLANKQFYSFLQSPSQTVRQAAYICLTVSYTHYRTECYEHIETLSGKVVARLRERDHVQKDMWGLVLTMGQDLFNHVNIKRDVVSALVSQLETQFNGYAQVGWSMLPELWTKLPLSVACDPQIVAKIIAACAHDGGGPGRVGGAARCAGRVALYCAEVAGGGGDDEEHKRRLSDVCDLLLPSLIYKGEVGGSGDGDAADGGEWGVGEVDQLPLAFYESLLGYVLNSMNGSTRGKGSEVSGAQHQSKSALNADKEGDEREGSVTGEGSPSTDGGVSGLERAVEQSVINWVIQLSNRLRRVESDEAVYVQQVLEAMLRVIGVGTGHVAVSTFDNYGRRELERSLICMGQLVEQAKGDVGVVQDRIVLYAKHCLGIISAFGGSIQAKGGLWNLFNMNARAVGSGGACSTGNTIDSCADVRENGGEGCSGWHEASRELVQAVDYVAQHISGETLESLGLSKVDMTDESALNKLLDVVAQQANGGTVLCSLLTALATHGPEPAQQVRALFHVMIPHSPVATPPLTHLHCDDLVPDLPLKSGVDQSDALQSTRALYGGQEECGKCGVGVASGIVVLACLYTQTQQFTTFPSSADSEASRAGPGLIDHVLDAIRRTSLSSLHTAAVLFMHTALLINTPSSQSQPTQRAYPLMSHTASKAISVYVLHIAQLVLQNLAPRSATTPPAPQLPFSMRSFESLLLFVVVILCPTMWPTEQLARALHVACDLRTAGHVLGRGNRAPQTALEQQPGASCRDIGRDGQGDGGDGVGEGGQNGEQVGDDTCRLVQDSGEVVWQYVRRMDEECVSQCVRAMVKACVQQTEQDDPQTTPQLPILSLLVMVAALDRACDSEPDGLKGAPPGSSSAQNEGKSDGTLLPPAGVDTTRLLNGLLGSLQQSMLASMEADFISLLNVNNSTCQLALLFSICHTQIQNTKIIIDAPLGALIALVRSHMHVVQPPIDKHTTHELDERDTPHELDEKDTTPSAGAEDYDVGEKLRGSWECAWVGRHDVEGVLVATFGYDAVVRALHACRKGLIGAMHARDTHARTQRGLPNRSEDHPQPTEQPHTLVNILSEAVTHVLSCTTQYPSANTQQASVQSDDSDDTTRDNRGMRCLSSTSRVREFAGILIAHDILAACKGEEGAQCMADYEAPMLRQITDHVKASGATSGDDSSVGSGGGAAQCNGSVVFSILLAGLYAHYKSVVCGGQGAGHVSPLSWTPLQRELVQSCCKLLSAGRGVSSKGGSDAAAGHVLTTCGNTVRLLVATECEGGCAAVGSGPAQHAEEQGPGGLESQPPRLQCAQQGSMLGFRDQQRTLMEFIGQYQSLVYKVGAKDSFAAQSWGTALLLAMHNSLPCTLPADSMHCHVHSGEYTPGVADSDQSAAAGWKDGEGSDVQQESFTAAVEAECKLYVQCVQHNASLARPFRVALTAQLIQKVGLECVDSSFQQFACKEVGAVSGQCVSALEGSVESAVEAVCEVANSVSNKQVNEPVPSVVLIQKLSTSGVLVRLPQYEAMVSSIEEQLKPPHQLQNDVLLALHLLIVMVRNAPDSKDLDKVKKKVIEDLYRTILCIGSLLHLCSVLELAQTKRAQELEAALDQLATQCLPLVRDNLVHGNEVTSALQSAQQWQLDIGMSPFQSLWSVLHTPSTSSPNPHPTTQISHNESLWVHNRQIIAASLLLHTVQVDGMVAECVQGVEEGRVVLTTNEQEEAAQVKAYFGSSVVRGEAEDGDGEAEDGSKEEECEIVIGLERFTHSLVPAQVVQAVQEPHGLMDYVIGWALVLGVLLQCAAHSHEQLLQYLVRGLKQDARAVQHLVSCIVHGIEGQEGSSGSHPLAENTQGKAMFPTLLQALITVGAYGHKSHHAHDRAFARACSAVYGALLQTIPLLVRDASAQLTNPQFALLEQHTIEEWTPRIVRDHFSELARLSNDSVVITPSLSMMSVSVVLEIDDGVAIALHILVPRSFPLAAPEAKCTSRAGFSEKRVRGLLLVINNYLRSQNEGMKNSVLLWKESVERNLADVEPCVICMCVLHVTDKSVPNMHCKNCRVPFHGTCLYKWFKTSGKPQCPHCQLPFDGGR